MINAVVLNAKKPMCAMHMRCSPSSHTEERWQGLMAKATTLPILQDTAAAGMFETLGKGLALHDDLMVFDRQHQLFAHLCSSTGMQPSCKVLPKFQPQANLRSEEGFAVAKTLVVAAAQSTQHCDMSTACRGKDVSHTVNITSLEEEVSIPAAERDSIATGKNKIIEALRFELASAKAQPVNGNKDSQPMNSSAACPGKEETRSAETRMIGVVMIAIVGSVVTIGGFVFLVKAVVAQQHESKQLSQQCFGNAGTEVSGDVELEPLTPADSI